MQHIIWRMEFFSPPAALRHCKKCGVKSRFLSSGQFRINAQQKNLDIWLIYKCEKCDGTWNHTLFSRVSPGAVKGGLLERLHGNDNALAMEYAMDTALLKQNGAEASLPEYRVSGDMPDPCSPAEITLVSAYQSALRAAAVIREKLGLSRGAFERMLEDGRIRCISGHELRKCRVSGEIVFELRHE